LEPENPLPSSQAKLNANLTSKFPAMNYRELGRTRLRVSEVGFGAWAIGGNQFGNSYGPTDDAASLAAIKTAIDLGCNFFDTADVYGHGHSEELLGKALEGNRDNVIIATKVGGDFYHDPPSLNFRTDYLEFALKKSCERLRTDYIDLYQLHTPPLQVIKSPEIFRTLEKFKTKGLVRHYGVSIHDPQEGVTAIKEANPETIQVVFNVLRQEAKNRLFTAAQNGQVGLIAREPLSNGFLAGKHDPDEQFPTGDIRHQFPKRYVLNLIQAAEKLRFLESRDRSMAQACIRFVLDHREISVTIPGVKTSTQAEEDFKASTISRLTGEELLRIRLLREQGFE
jgi:aryl-alcohol dehydrogenase-like predicted oxidoreductase